MNSNEQFNNVDRVTAQKIGRHSVEYVSRSQIDPSRDYRNQRTC